MNIYFSNWNDLFFMDGYGPYVWTAYTVVFVVITGYILTSFLQHKKQMKRIKLWHKENEKNTVLPGSINDKAPL